MDGWGGSWQMVRRTVCTEIWGWCGKVERTWLWSSKLTWLLRGQWVSSGVGTFATGLLTLRGTVTNRRPWVEAHRKQWEALKEISVQLRREHLLDDLNPSEGLALRMCWWEDGLGLVMFCNLKCMIFFSKYLMSVDAWKVSEF